MSLNSGETLQPFKALNQLIFDSSGNLIGIQNDRAVGNDLRIGGGSGVDGTFATLIATTALKLNSGATFDLYNTADQTTNYERLRAQWTGNIADILTQQSGTGTIRNLRIGTATAGGGIARYLEFAAVGTATTSANFVTTLTGSAGTQLAVSLRPTFAQSGTAAYTAFDIDVTESTTGSGTKLLQRWAVGGSEKGRIGNDGVIAGLFLSSTGNIGFSTAFGSANDVTLFRDAADTLALRRGTNAQTFRVYNTYTDGSNYERVSSTWSGSIFYLVTEQAGTGTARSMAIGTTGVASLSFLTSNSSRWQMSSAGHFIATTDNTYDIGASGANRPRAIYAALSLNSPEWRMSLVTVAGLSATNNSRMMVSDSTLPFAAANIGTAVTGGGANTVPVIRIGGTWYIG